MTSCFAGLLPSDVVVREALVPDVDPDELGRPIEQEWVAGAVPRRRREYLLARDLARVALRELGAACGDIGTGASREPLWPAGVVGAITHHDERVAVAVGHATTYAGLGIDLAADRPLDPGVLDLVLTARERAQVSAKTAENHLATVAFSVKESIYKVWFPAHRCWLDFDAAEVDVHHAGTWSAEVRHPALATSWFPRGRWSATGGVLRTSLAVVAGGAPC